MKAAEFDTCKRYGKPAASAILPPEEEIPYPRTCAHRGFNAIAPENSLPAFGAAVALGAEEIEFDLWYTKDGEIVSVHDKQLDRVSNGTGIVAEHTLAELQTLDFSGGYEALRGLGVVRFEDILRKFACQTIMNIHIKTMTGDCDYDPAHLRRIIALLRQYGCEKHAYLMCVNDRVLAMAQSLAPDICRCVGTGADPEHMVERALRYDCKKIQLFKGKFTPDTVRRAHENGILCNVFYADTPEDAEAYLDMGIDTILSNTYFRIAQVVAKREKYRYEDGKVTRL